MTTQAAESTTETMIESPDPFHYHVGKNIPGYGSESDPYLTDIWESARDALLDDLDSDSLTDDWDGPDGEKWEALAKEWDAAKLEVEFLEPGSEYSTIVPLSFSEHDLGLSVWMISCSDECDLDADD